MTTKQTNKKKEIISFTALTQFKKSPNHLLAYWEKEFKPTSAMIKGGLGHLLLLEHEKFSNKYIIYEGGSRRGKNWEAFKIEHEDKEIITIKEYEEVSFLHNKIKNNPLLVKYLNQLNECEKHVEWERFGQKFHGYIDGVADDFLMDIKFCQDSGPKFLEDLKWNNHKLQASMYLDAFNYDRDYLLVAIEKNPPFNVSIIRLSINDIQQGQDEYFSLTEKYKEWDGKPCGYYTEIQDL